MLVHRPRNSMYFGWMLLCASLLLAASVPGGERTALQTSLGTQTNNGGTPIWSFDLDSDYTFGSSIQKYSSFGPQAGYHYEIEVLRDVPFSTSTLFNLGSIPSGSHSRVEQPIPLCHDERGSRNCRFLLGRG